MLLSKRQKLTLHHQVSEDFLQLVQDGYRYLVLDGLLVRSLALSKQTICTGGQTCRHDVLEAKLLTRSELREPVRSD